MLQSAPGPKSWPRCSGSWNAAPEQRSDGLLRGPFEKGFHHMSQSGASRDFSRNARNVNVSQALFFVMNMPFFFQQAQLRPHSRIVRLAIKLREHVSHRRALQLVENVHDLPLAPRKSLRLWLPLHSSSPHATFVA